MNTDPLGKYTIYILLPHYKQQTERGPQKDSNRTQKSAFKFDIFENGFKKLFLVKK